MTPEEKAQGIIRYGFYSIGSDERVAITESGEKWLKEAITTAIREAVEAEREALAKWMIKNGFSTGHGDTLADLLCELEWQTNELRAIRARDKT